MLGDAEADAAVGVEAGEALVHERDAVARGILVGQIVSTVPSTTIGVPSLSVARSCTAWCNSGFVGS